MISPMRAPQILRVARNPIRAPKNLPCHPIRVDLFVAHRHNLLPFHTPMVAAGGPLSRATIIAVAAALRVATQESEEVTSGQGPRHLRGRCGPYADRDDRPAVGIRCGHGG